MFEMTFTRKFEAAHRLIAVDGGKSKCAQPHGHTWYVTVYLEPTEKKPLDNNENTLVLFSQAKKKWHEWIDNHIDHAFFFNSKDPMLNFMKEDLPEGRHLVSPGDPTTEMLAVLFKSKLDAILSDDDMPLKCERLHIQETPTNGITFSGDPKKHLPESASGKKNWWERSDLSTNDF